MQSTSGWYRDKMNAMTRLASKKSTMVSGDPVASVVRTMTKALSELASKYRASTEKLERAMEKESRNQRTAVRNLIWPPAKAA